MQLATIGYEGAALADFISTLVAAGIERVVDVQAQKGLFEAIGRAIPRHPCPYSFVYRYRDDDGPHDGTCQDWETEATFFQRLKEMGSEQEALDRMQQVW